MKGTRLLLVCCFSAVASAQNGKKESGGIEIGNNQRKNRFLDGFLTGKSQESSEPFGGRQRFGSDFELNQGFSGSFGFQELTPGFSSSLEEITPGFSGDFGTTNPNFGGDFGSINSGLGTGGFGGIRPNIGGAFGLDASGTCRYWCRTPQGQNYCCEGNDKPASVIFVKPGLCPPVRPNCPPVRSLVPPHSCANDGRCSGVDKCCFDTCLQKSVCKPPVGSTGII
ncbi:uncharacterized protein [Palaemon carinicauda]|uniref:uncharacterized protein n=1 Tax=Palaemon carinicauda TaxID=392227 RepID=UPI0035B58D8B